MTTEPIPLSRPDITDAERHAVAGVLRTDRLSMGPHLEAFEQATAALAGRAFGVGVNSGTSGLHLCVKALGLGPGDEVLTTPFSFIATTNCLLYEQATPVFVDIDPDSYNMDPDRLADALTERTRAILLVEIFGNPAHFERYEQFARKHNLLLIEDCCEALGGHLNGRRTGSFGDCGVFAFYPNKQLTTGEGGMVVTDNADLAACARSLRNQGRGDGGWLTHVRLGYNYRMSELAATIGVAQIGRLDAILRRRRQVASWYHDALADVEEIHLPPMTEPDKASWFVYVVRLADRFDHRDRQAVVDGLTSGGIGCERYFQPIHLQPFIREILGTAPGDFPHCERVSDRTIALPFFTTMRHDQVRCVAERLKAALAALA
ncbi:MAG: DegT/DnrJ/EryC1/StrS family aminotransferase [Planctomycetes bacterium]|nr:DegT/DnrJ/EryC1/StrS family aminotransferase [Planctomycetota bacterium]